MKRTADAPRSVRRGRESPAFEAFHRDYRDLYEFAPDMFLSVEADTGNVLQCNQTFVDATGFEKKEVLGRPIVEIFDPEGGELARQALQDLSKTGEVRNAEFWLRKKDGTKLPVSLNASAVRDEAGRFVCSQTVLRDVTERNRLESLLEGQSRVLELVAAGASLEEIATKLIETVEEHAPGMLCSTLLFDPNKRCLRHVAAPSLPRAYNQAIDGVHIGPAVGSCGTSAFRGTRVVVEDIQEDPLWADYRELAASHGLRACWSQPILSKDHGVLGTFAMYYGEPIGPTRWELELIERAANLAGIAIERTRAAEAVEFALRELDHRVKNTLATVESVAEYTLESSTTLGDFEEAFRGRIRTLARLHMALAKRDFRALGLRRLVELSVAPWRRDEESVRIVGDDVDIPSTAVRALGMVLHELATNAAKYGALSVAGGHAEVSWRLESMAIGHRLRIEWQEREGPPVPIPERRGFGTMLIEEALTHELGGTTSLEFPGTGVRCEILVPMPQT